MPNKNKVSMENKIMAMVNSGEIKMKPKIYFVLGTFASFIGLVGLITGAVFFTNLTLFMILKKGPGTGRLIQMMESFPVWIPVLALILILLGTLFIRKYEFSYKRNFRTVAFVFILAVILSASLIRVLGLDEIWFSRGPLRRFVNSEHLQKYRQYNKGPNIYQKYR